MWGGKGGQGVAPLGIRILGSCVKWTLPRAAKVGTMSASPRVPQISPSPPSHTHSLGLESPKVGTDRPGGSKLSSDNDGSQNRAKIAH